jgi:hypothetical protein
MNLQFRVAASILAVAVSSIAATDANAFPSLGSITGAISTPASSTDNSTPSIDADALVAQGQGIEDNFNILINNLLLAQARVAAAFGLKDDADRAEKEADPYANSQPLDSDRLKQSLAVIKDVAKDIAEKKAQNSGVDSDGRNQLTLASQHYAKVLQAGTGLPKSVQNYIQSGKSAVTTLSSHPTQALELKKLSGTLSSVELLGSNLQDVGSLAVDSIHFFIPVAKSNGLSTSNIKDLPSDGSGFAG